MGFRVFILSQVILASFMGGPAFAGNRTGTRPRNGSTSPLNQTGATTVAWSNMVNCQVSGGVLQKTSGCNGCADAHASSSQPLVAGDGFLQFVADNAKTDRYCGLSYQGNNPNYSGIDFAFHLSAIGDLEVREDNAYRTDVRYSVGDVLEVSIASGVVTYYKNGALIYTSKKAPVYPIVADASLLTSNSTIAGAAGALAAAPVLSILNQSTSARTTTGATITWTTNLPSNSQVQYGLTTSYGSATASDPTMTSNHSVTLAGLQAGTTYNYRVSSNDSNGNAVTSGNQVFTTLSPASPNGVALPAVWVDTTMPASSGAVYNVASGGDLQAALNQARPGDTIMLQAGATFVAPSGGFVLPPKNNPNQLWVTVRTSAGTNLPAPGVRVGPENAPSMPKILSPDTGAALATETGAGAGTVAYWRIIGVEISVTPSALPDANASGAPANTGLLRLGDPYETSLQNVPHHLVVDRCYIHGGPTVNTIRGVNLNSAYSAVIDSYLSDFHGVQWESQAIAGWNGPGPYCIVDNYLEGASENVMFGGADPKIQNLIPSDIEISHNHFFKPTAWRVSSPGYLGYHWNVKNIFELKNASRVLIDGNIFENCWADGQIGYAISIKSSNQDGAAPWSETADVTFQHNMVRNAAIGVQVAARDNTWTVQVTARIEIANNVFENINSAATGGSGTLVRIIGQNAPAGLASSGPSNVTVDHNTGFVSSNNYGKMIEVDDVSPNFVFTNNIFDYCSYGAKGDGTADGNQTLSTYFPGIVFLRNCAVGNSTGAANFSSYPGNYFPPAWSSVQFVNYKGGLGGDYHLLPGSPYKNAGTDGADLGANIDAVNSATALVN